MQVSDLTLEELAEERALAHGRRRVLLTGANLTKSSAIFQLHRPGKPDLRQEQELELTVFGTFVNMTACLNLARAQVTHGEPGHAKRSPLDRRGPGIYVYRELKGSLKGVHLPLAAMSCSEQHTFNTYVSAEGPLPPSEVALRSLELGSIPAATMLLGSLATILAPKPPPKVVAHALQHLAAGIMMCAIAMELVPPMAKAKGQSSVFALVVGFSLGVAVMIGLSIFLDEVGDGGSDGGESEGDLDVGLGDVAAAESEALLSGELRDSAVDGESEDSGGVAPRSKVGQAYSHVSDEQGAGGIRGGARVELQQPMFPWLFAFCVYVDSCMDGLLVGLALVTGNSAGVFMAAAMAVEMGFLGLTFAAACTSQPLYLALPAVVAGPFFLVCGSALGGVVANSLAANEPALVGCTAFSVAALLYMVCEELLVSAHEEDDHVWWVDIQVFIGFLLAMLMNKLIEHGA